MVSLLSLVFARSRWTRAEGNNMRVVFFCYGIPKSNDAGRRSLRALQWLSARHEVSVVPVYREGDQLHEVTNETADLSIDRPLFLPSPSRATRRLWAGLSPRIRDQLNRELLARARNADWIWLSPPTLAGAGSAIRALQAEGTKASWDWDALSLLRLTQAKAIVRRSPLRAASHAAIAGSLMAFERRYLNQLDAISVPSPREQVWFERYLSVPIRTIRNFIDTDDFGAARKSLVDSTKQIALFIGSRYHDPNVFGINWFIKEVWENVVMRVPKARLHIVGHGMTADLFPSPPPGVDVLGGVADLTPHLAEARVVICPVFYGGGTPYKVVEGAASARPTLVTSYCASAMNVNGGLLVEDSSVRWAEILINLFEDPAMAMSAGAEAFRAVGDRFGKEQWEADMASLEAAITAR
jgi:glycosyltransferase involved in cell wall biosynthesis